MNLLRFVPPAVMQFVEPVNDPPPITSLACHQLNGGQIELDEQHLRMQMMLDNAHVDRHKVNLGERASVLNCSISVFITNQFAIWSALGSFCSLSPVDSFHSVLMLIAPIALIVGLGWPVRPSSSRRSTGQVKSRRSVPRAIVPLMKHLPCVCVCCVCALVFVQFVRSLLSVWQIC